MGFSCPGKLPALWISHSTFLQFLQRVEKREAPEHAGAHWHTPTGAFGMGIGEKWVAAAKISLRRSHKRFMMQGMSVNAHSSVTKIIKSYYNITIILHI